MAEAPPKVRAQPWLNVVLFEPEIPPNTGNVMRLCANTGAALHLIEPLGFELDDRRLRRAGLDYRDTAIVRRYKGLAEAKEALGGSRWLTLSTRGGPSVYATSFAAGDVLLFGPETRGLPDDVREMVAPDRRLRIPMQPGSRSLNLSNAVSVVVFEAWRQLGFPGAAGSG